MSKALCLVPKIIPVRPKVQELLEDLLHPDGTNSDLYVRTHAKTHTHTQSIVWMVLCECLTNTFIVKHFIIIYHISNVVFYLLNTSAGCRAFSLGCGLVVILGCRGNNALCILFCHLYKLIQVHQLFGWEDMMQGIIQECTVSPLSLSGHLPSLLTMLSNTFWVWVEVGPGILLAVPPTGEKWPQHHWVRTLHCMPACNVILFTRTAAKTDITKGNNLNIYL